MSTTTTVTTQCDFHGRGATGKRCDNTEKVETVEYRLDSRDLLIDLCDAHKDTFMTQTAPWVVLSREAPVKSAGRKTSRSDASAIREWAKAQGKEVSERGRIPDEVVKAYEAAQAESAPDASGDAKAEDAKADASA